MQNCSPAAARICNECAALQTGGVRAVIFVKKDVYISDDNYFNELFWLKLDYQKKAFFIHKARGSYVPEPVLADGFGTDGQIVVGINNTLTYEEPFDVLNLDFYNSVANSSEYRVIFVTGGDIRDGGTAATISAISAVGAIDTQNVFAVTVAWRTTGIIKSNAGTPPLILTDCAYFEQQKELYCPPPSPVCVEQGEILANYPGGSSYPSTPGQFEIDYTFEDVPSYPIVALQQTTPAQAFFDTFDVVENGVIIASADPARLGITGIYSMADLVAATPLNAFDQSQWAVKYDLSNSYRVATWYNNGIGGGEGIFKSVKVYVRGFAQFRLHLFCAPTVFAPDPFLLPFEPKNAYVASEETRVCLCPKLTVSPLTSTLLLDGSPDSSFLQLDPNTTYEYSLTGNFIDAEWQRKVCCGFPSVMFVFVGSKLTIVLNASNTGPVILDGVTFTYDPLTYTVTVETPSDVTGINFTAVASVENCETQNHSFGLGDCALPDIRFLFEGVDAVTYLTANPTVNAAIPVTASGVGVTYLGGLNYEWATPQTSSMTINANIVAPSDRDPSADCCPEYRPEFTSGSTIVFVITSPCSGGGAFVSQGSPNDNFQNYSFQWQTGMGGDAQVVIKNDLDPLENPCDLVVSIQSVVCGLSLNRTINVSMVNTCSNNIDFIEPFQGPAANYLAANPSVDAVFEYTPLNQLFYVGLVQYTWDSAINNALLRCVLTEQPGNPLSCCADYAQVVAGETGSFTVNSPCLSAPVEINFANPVVGDNGFTFIYNNGAGYFALVIVNDNAPTQAGPCVFTITSCVGFCTDQSTCNTGPIINVT